MCARAVPCEGPSRGSGSHGCWAYGAGFDRRTEERVAEAGLEVIGSSFVVDDLIKLISIRAIK